MKMQKSMKAVALLLLLASLFTTLTGCGGLVAPAEPTNSDPILFNGLTAFTARPFADCGAFNWQYSLKVRVVEDRIYLNDVLYREIPNEGFKMTNANGFFHCWVEGKDTKDFLEKLNSSKMHCLLEAETESKFGQQIAVYDIDGAFYFLSFYNSSEVMRIHYIEYAKAE